MEQCPVCDGGVERVRELREVTLGARTVTVEDELFRCGDCGEAFYDESMMDATLARAAEQIRAQDGLPAPDEIRRLRRELGFTQAEFETVIGSGPKTVTRWEKGTVSPTGAAGTLLRLLQRHPELALELARERGVRKAPAA